MTNQLRRPLIIALAMPAHAEIVERLSNRWKDRKRLAISGFGFREAPRLQIGPRLRHLLRDPVGNGGGRGGRMFFGRHARPFKLTSGTVELFCTERNRRMAIRIER
ncbi:MAG: hypothetical protein WDO24_14305 [Pseudomonadota bacterium]